MARQRAAMAIRLSRGTGGRGASEAAASLRVEDVPGAVRITATNTTATVAGAASTTSNTQRALDFPELGAKRFGLGPRQARELAGGPLFRGLAHPMQGHLSQHNV